MKQREALVGEKETTEARIHFADGEKLKILNTFFKTRLEKKWVWCSRDSKSRNEIDFTLTDQIHNYRKWLLSLTSDSTLTIEGLQQKKEFPENKQSSVKINLLTRL